MGEGQVGQTGRRLPQAGILGVLCFGLLIRSLVSTFGHSGRGVPPMFGDFEAQRHWMEVTLALPIGDWYRQTAENNLQYWGLDYPPLTAYLSLAFAHVAKFFVPNLVEWETSRGFEEPEGLLYMRLTVLLCDALFFLPIALLLISFIWESTPQLVQFASPSRIILSACAFCVCPAIILIDNGHFQYNGVAMGLTFLASYAILRGYDLVGAVAYTFALNFKHISLYHSLVFFAVLLRKCILAGYGMESESSSDPQVSRTVRFQWQKSLWKFVLIGGTVIVSFVLSWMPFCIWHAPSETCTSSLLAVVSRLFPFARGLFEDKVANLWFTLSRLIDIRTRFELTTLVRGALVLTLFMMSPIVYLLLKRPLTSVRFLVALSASGLVFFLASFQVHEKAIILTAIPLMTVLPCYPSLVQWCQVLAVFTMHPLLIRDVLRVPYWAVTVVFLAIVDGANLAYAYNSAEQPIFVLDLSKIHHLLPTLISLGIRASYFVMICLHFAEFFIQPPAHLPDLYAVLFSLFGATQFLALYVVLILILASPSSTDTKPKIH